MCTVKDFSDCFEKVEIRQLFAQVSQTLTWFLYSMVVKVGPFYRCVIFCLFVMSELMLYVPVNSNGHVGMLPPFYGTSTQH